MSRATLLTALFAGLAVFACAQNPESNFRPSDLQSFAAQPGSRVTWQMELVRMTTGHSNATLTAVVVENGPRKLRGIRVDLAQGEKRGAVYIDEPMFDLYKRALGSIARAVGDPRDQRRIPASFVGACEFRDNPHPIRVDHYFEHWGNGLRVVAAGLYPEFRFPDQRADTLLRAIEIAEADLKDR